MTWNPLRARRECDTRRIAAVILALPDDRHYGWPLSRPEEKWMSRHGFDRTGMHEAEANDPGCIHRHGWMYMRCRLCAEVIYDGREISMPDAAHLRAAHDLTCRASRLVTWWAVVRWRLFG